MFIKKTLIAFATAGLIAAGGLAATTETASAGQRGYNFQIGNSGIYFNYGYRANPRRTCTQRVRWRDHYGRSHWKRIKVQCFRPRHRHHHYARQHHHQRNSGFNFQFRF